MKPTFETEYRVVTPDGKKERKRTMKPAFETEYRIVTPDGKNVLDDTGWPRSFKHKRSAQSWIKMMKARGDKTNYSIIAETFEVIYTTMR